MTQKRKRNTPKKYPNPGTGDGANPRHACPKCGRYMYKSKSAFTNDEGKRESITPNEFCKCGYVVINKVDLKKIPD